MMQYMNGKGKKKLQSAMEYLTTYGWAILIIAVALAALSLLNVFNPSSSVNQECILEAGLTCISFQISGSGILTINILQSTQSQINVTSIGCSSNLTAASMTKFKPEVYMPIGSNDTFTGIQCYQGDKPFSGKPGSVFVGSVIVNYTDDITGFPQVSYGKIVVKVS